MTTTSKLLLAATGFAAAVVLLPVALAVLSPRSTACYFDGGRCACGHRIYLRLAGEGYYDYSPGHGVQEYRKFTLRPNTNGWDVIRVNDPRYDEVYSQLAPTGLVAQAWIDKGELCERWGTSSRVLRYSRIYDPWPIWWAKLLPE
jgi:hypothetical protein